MASKAPSNEDILENVDKTFTHLDQQRMSGLEKIKMLQSIKNDSLKREGLRQSKKYGALHPRVKIISDRLIYNQGLKKEVDSEIDKTKIIIPDFDINTWIVHGRVTNQKGDVLSGLTLSLYNEKGSWIKELGYACTDSRGYYAIRYKVDPKNEGKIPEKEKLILTVTDSKSKILHQEDKALFARIGKIDYRLIILEKNLGSCNPPQPVDDDNMDLRPNYWVVRGNVHNEKKQPLSALTVSLYDKDHIYDDRLGSTLTDENGNFQIKFCTQDFQDIIKKNPGIFLKVQDKKARTIYSSRRKMRCSTGKTEEFNIKIKR